MSVNITVNDKFGKHCRPHPLLSDPQELRKSEEKERRKLRLLQVREQSKQLAKQIREEVNEEKKRELQKLQAAKERELECWRRHALQQKGQEYREAIFQIGTAHRAAKMDNLERVEKQKNKPETYKYFKKQMIARKCQPGKVQFSCQTACPCQQSVSPCATKQSKCTCTQTEDTNKNDEIHKRKRDLSFSSTESECEDEGYKEQTTLPQSSLSFSSSCDNISTSFSNNRSTQTSMFVPTKSKCLIKTPAVYLDVEVGTDDSVTISAPAEIKDKHVKYNRQFSSVIRVNPRTEKENMSENPALHLTSTTSTLTSDTTDKQASNTKEKSQNNQPVGAVTSKEKRFTIISDLVKKQQEDGSILRNNKLPYYPASQLAPVVPHLSPKKQLKEAVIRPPLVRSQTLSPRKAATKSSRTVTSNTQPASTTTLTATTKTSTIAPIDSSSSGRVQFYDYNSKLSKERDHNATSVSVKRQKNQTQPTAMEQAELENQRERERQLEALKRFQQTEERGQKALEREQVRRDCNELTEKLEALTREYPNQVPTNENQLHIFADKELRKEGKMNSAVEKLLQRPSIITCSERSKPIKSDTQTKPFNPAVNLGNELNVAALDQKPLSADDVSSDSCCSILLGYVDDQSRLVKQDLQNNNATRNESKQNRLKNLLKRLDELRNALIQELKNENESKTKRRDDENSKLSSKKENLQQAIKSLSEMRKEREQILITEKPQEIKPLREREKELQAKEAILEQKVREFFDLQNQQETTKSKLNYNKNKDIKEDTVFSNEKNKNSNDKENVVCTSGEEPLEIIITVRGDTKCVKLPQKSKRKVFRKSPSKVSTLIKSSQQKKHILRKKLQNTKTLGTEGILIQNSYDSNSTSYMSLPPELPTKIGDLAERINRERSQTQIDNKKFPSNQDRKADFETPLKPLSDHSCSTPAPRINPLIAQYVQRLLGMSRDAIQKLGVSSSEIDTPGSSIINTTENIANSDAIISEERLIAVNNFMEENRSFIKDLEQSIRSQNNVSLENSIRMFDDIWRKRLKKHIANSTKQQDKTKMKKRIAKKENVGEKLSSNTKPALADPNVTQTNKTLSSNSEKIEHKVSTDNLRKELGKSLSSHYSSDDKESLKSSKTAQHVAEKSDKAFDKKNPADSSKTEPDTQIARYAKLTENCTNRIAELTELINRVREEKQRLLEVTLSSVSDNGRQSTEYLELPEGKSSVRHIQEDSTRASSSSEETTQNKQSHSSNALQYEMTKLSSADKNKQITASRDSGIAESRPITALENRIDQEPTSQTSSESTMPQALRKMKPPPTLKRFSPQLPEDELAHELSTILEVDTPATSRINTAVGQTAEEQENVLDNGHQQPVKFPTFKQYMKQLNLDITQLDSEQSIQLQIESFFEWMRQNRTPGEHLQHAEFPSISAYLQHLSKISDNLGDTMEESLAQLHISGINPRYFPALREYMKKNSTKSLPDEPQLLDTESLENITEEPSHPNTEDTASIDIEAELKKRKILKNSFRFIEKKKQEEGSSTVDKDTKSHQKIIPAESGIDKLSTSSDSLDSDLQRIVLPYMREFQNKSKGIKILSSTTTSANASALANSALRAASLDDSSKNCGQALNLRDFLTRELLKRANITGSSSNSSSDDTLRSQFLHSLIGSLTPRTPGIASKSGGQTLDRQKTSTPVPMQSSQSHSSASTHSNSSNQLFSGESHLSSVHYQDRSVRLLTSDGGNADQSSE